MIIYLITNLINNKKYVGQTVQTLEKRFRRHCWKSTTKSSMPISHAISLYGKENFTIEILFKCSSLEEMNEKEIYFTNQLNTWSPNGYNLRAGNGQGSMSQETKDKISKANTGRKATDEQRKNMSEAHKGKVLPPEQRKKISDANKGENNKFFGQKHSKETIDKLSKTYTLLSPEGEIMIIKNLAEHCRLYGINYGNMNAVVNGHRKSCSGWRLGLTDSTKTEI